MRSLLLLIVLAASPALAQDGMGDMPGMDMTPTGVLGAYPMSRDASGTSWQPDAAEHRAIHAMAGDWTLMGHLMLEAVADTQSGPRGHSKFFVAGMAMGAARRDFADGDTLNLRLMLSPDPFMGRGGYPLLLATGETANGSTPLIDRQHPHDLVMEMSASYSHRLDETDSVFLYAGYPGEPALGPAAFMHRASSMDIPDAPITHHWLDSTHIVFGVLTAGFVRDDWKLELSQFTGREPDENRFDFDPIRLDSTSARLSWNPGPNWSLQASWGDLKSPEELAPNVDENRVTASATYVSGPWAATVAWGLRRESTGVQLNGLLAETEYKPDDAWTLFARGEWEENDELSPGAKPRVGQLTLGAIHDWPVAKHWKLGLGGLYAFDFVPAGIVPSYGGDPHGAMGFARIVAD